MEPGPQAGALCAVAEAKRHCLRPRRADHDGLSTVQQPELIIEFTKGPTPRSTCSSNGTSKMLSVRPCECLKTSRCVHIFSSTTLLHSAQQGTVRNPGFGAAEPPGKRTPDVSVSQDEFLVVDSSLQLVPPAVEPPHPGQRHLPCLLVCCQR